MPSKNPAQSLHDILDNIEAIEAFTATGGFVEFARDRKTLYAVTCALEIISEASRRLPTELKDRHREIDWPAIAAVGNVYRHEYDVMDETVIWHTVRYGLRALRKAAEEELKTLGLEP